MPLVTLAVNFYVLKIIIKFVSYVPSMIILTNHVTEEGWTTLTINFDGGKF